MRKHDDVDRYKSHEFDILLDAVLNEPHKVKDIVVSNRDCLKAVNNTGENVLHWLAVENHTEGVALLRSLDSPIPEFALIHALEAGNSAIKQNVLCAVILSNLAMNFNKGIKSFAPHHSN